VMVSGTEGRHSFLPICGTLHGSVPVAARPDDRAVVATRYCPLL
jgi:hypothetical protein